MQKHKLHSRLSYFYLAGFAPSHGPHLLSFVAITILSYCSRNFLTVLSHLSISSNLSPLLPGPVLLVPQLPCLRKTFAKARAPGRVARCSVIDTLIATRNAAAGPGAATWGPPSSVFNDVKLAVVAFVISVAPSEPPAIGNDIIVNSTEGEVPPPECTVPDSSLSNPSLGLFTAGLEMTKQEPELFHEAQV